MPTAPKNEFVEADTLPNVVASALAAAAKPSVIVIEEVPHLLLPEGFAHISMESLMMGPLRPKGTVKLDDTPSFTTYVAAHKYGDESLIYCSADYRTGKVEFVAVLNEHVAGEPGWRDFRATYAPRQSEEWARWSKCNHNPFPQAAFAAFIEDNLRDFAQVEGFPTGSQMLAMALDLEIKQDARFKSAVRLQSGGVDMTFVQKEDDSTLEKMRVFDRFALGIAPFFNGEAYQVEARLRYRVKDGALSFWYELIRPDLTVADATRTEITKIVDGTGLKVLYGTP